MEKSFDIDIIYLWVDGNDPAWQEKRRRFVGNPEEDRKGDATSAGRYTDNDELKYNLRALEKYAPWIRKIFIVTDGQVPKWLDTGNQKVTIVDQNDIVPAEGLPCFNSNVIEHNFYKIPGLAEHFLYANDDMFINRTVSPLDFFTKDGLPIVRLKRSRWRKLTLWMKEKLLHQPLSKYNQALKNASGLIKEHYGVEMWDKSHHNIDSYLKSSYQQTVELFNDEISATFKNHMRADSDVQRIIYSYVPLMEGAAQKEYIGKDISFMLRIHKQDHYERLQRCNPMFFCLNDSQYATDDDRLRVRAFLISRFPDKSSFEK